MLIEEFIRDEAYYEGAKQFEEEINKVKSSENWEINLTFNIYIIIISGKDDSVTIINEMIDSKEPQIMNLEDFLEFIKKAQK